MLQAADKANTENAQPKKNNPCKLMAACEYAEIEAKRICEEKGWRLIDCLRIGMERAVGSIEIVDKDELRILLTKRHGERLRNNQELN